MLNKEKIRKGVTCPIDIKIYDLTDSTNTRAKEYAKECGDCPPTLFIAREQSAGRGRMGRQFLSRADSGIFMSLLYFTAQPLANAVSVTTAAAVFVAEEIETAVGMPMKIKWVNDVYSDQGKVCGILTEALRIGERYAIIVGIGINTGELDFPEELRKIAASLGDVSGKEDDMVSAIVEKLLNQAKNPTDRGYMKGYRKRFMLRGEKVTLYMNGESIGLGRVVDVDDDGGLVYLPEGEDLPKTIHSGEVSVRIK